MFQERSRLLIALCERPALSRAGTDPIEFFRSVFAIRGLVIMRD
jgi:hypothetical protein